MNVITAAIITGTFTLVAAIVNAFKDEIKEYFRRKKRDAGPYLGLEEFERVQSLPSTSLLFGDKFRKRPFDSKTTLLIGRRTGDLLVRFGSTNKNWFSTIFIFGWLIGWTTGIVFVAYFLFGMLFFGLEADPPDSFGWFPTVFLTGWLIAAVAGEVAAVNSFKTCIETIIGTTEWRVTEQDIVVSKRLWSFVNTKYYERDKIDGFGTQGDAIFFRHGKTRVAFNGLTENELEWLYQQLQTTIQADRVHIDVIVRQA